jgi:hypothetical protein
VGVLADEVKVFNNEARVFDNEARVFNKKARVFNNEASVCVPDGVCWGSGRSVAYHQTMVTLCAPARECSCRRHVSGCVVLRSSLWLTTNR